MGLFHIGKIIHGGVKVVKGIIEEDGKEVAKGAKKIAKGIGGLLLGKSDNDDTIDDDDDD